MIHTYVFKENSSDRDFKTICKKIEKDCPEYALAKQESYEGRIESVIWKKGKMSIFAELEKDHGAVTVCSDEPLPKLDKLSKLWKKGNYGIIRKLRRITDIKTVSGIKFKFIFLPLLLLAAAFLGSAVNSGTVSFDMFMGHIGTALADLLLNWIFLGQTCLIPIGAVLAAAANRPENPACPEEEAPSQKGIRGRLRELIKHEADFIILLASAALPALNVCYAGVRSALFERLELLAHNISRFPAYAPLALFICALPYLVIESFVSSGMTKRMKAPSVKSQILLGFCSLLAAVTAAFSCSDLCTGLYNMNYDANYARNCNAERIYTEASRELIAAKYADELNEIAEYALANSYYNWTECPDERLEKQWEEIFLEGRADYEITADENGIVFEILGKKYKLTPGAGMEEYK